MRLVAVIVMLVVVSISAGAALANPTEEPKWFTPQVGVALSVESQDATSVTYAAQQTKGPAYELVAEQRCYAANGLSLKQYKPVPGTERKQLGTVTFATDLPIPEYDGGGNLIAEHDATYCTARAWTNTLPDLRISNTVTVYL